MDPGTSSVLVGNPAILFPMFFTILGILLTGGALAWFFRSGTNVIIALSTAQEALAKANKTGEDLAVAKSRMDSFEGALRESQLMVGAKIEDARRIASEAMTRVSTLEESLSRQASNVNTIERRVGSTEAVLQEVRQRLAKLDQVDIMTAASVYTKKTLDDIQAALAGMIPRRELDQMREDIDGRIERTERDIRAITTGTTSE